MASRGIVRAARKEFDSIYKDAKPYLAKSAPTPTFVRERSRNAQKGADAFQNPNNDTIHFGRQAIKGLAKGERSWKGLALHEIGHTEQPIGIARRKAEREANQFTRKVGGKLFDLSRKRSY